jgi:hypothetical protein
VWTGETFFIAHLIEYVTIHLIPISRSDGYSKSMVHARQGLENILLKLDSCLSDAP